MKEIESIFSDLDTKNHTELDSYFTPHLSPIDALRVILYKFSLFIHYYKERILDHGEAEDLHQFRVNIRKSRAFLKEFKFLLPDEAYTYFNDRLSFFASQTNHKRDLDVIKERLKEVDTDHDVIQEDIAVQRQNETQKIEEMLKSKMFNDFFQTYQNTLKNQTLLTSDNTDGTIENTARKVIRHLHLDIIKKIEALEKDFSDKKLHKIRISFKKLRYLLEEFPHIFGEEKIEKMIEKGKKLQTLLGDFNDTVNQNKLLHNYFKSHKKSISHSKGLERRLLKKTSKSQKELLKKTRKKLHKFKKKTLEI
ncbi:MAG TPA: CHAD domain-containing protein [Sulfurovum sp.]